MKKSITLLLLLCIVLSSISCNFQSPPPQTSGTTTTTTFENMHNPDVPEDDTLKDKPYFELSSQLDFLGILSPTYSPLVDGGYSYEYCGVAMRYVINNTIIPNISNPIMNEVQFIDKQFISKYTIVDSDTIALDRIPENLVHVPTTNGDEVFYQLSENVYYEYREKSKLQEGTLDLFQILFLSPDHSYGVALVCYGKMISNGFALYSDHPDLPVARMLDPETAVEATNEFWEIVFPDSAKSPAK